MTLDEKYLNEQADSVIIEESGCYTGVITKAELFEAGDSKAVALNLTIKVNEDILPLSLFFKAKDGKDIAFNLRHIAHLMYLTKHKPELNPVVRGEKLVIEELEGAGIGVIVECKQNDGRVERRIQTFVDMKYKRTAKENKDGVDTPVTWNKYCEKYGKVVEHDDEFPF